MDNSFIFLSILSGSAGGGLFYKILESTLTHKIKMQIELDYNVKFEDAKKKLEKKATEFQIQYSKLHIDRSEKLKEVYENLVLAEMALEQLVTLAQGPEWTSDTDKEEKANENIDILKKNISKNRIFFSNDLCVKFDLLIIEYIEVIASMRHAKYLGKTEQENRHINIDATSIWKKQRDKVENEIKKLRIEIEIEFRNLLGV